MLKKSGQEMGSASTDRDLVLLCASPGTPGESRKAALLRAAKNTGLSYQRIVAFFYSKGNPPLEAREILRREAERRRLTQAWGDIGLDKRLAEMSAQYERLKRDVEELDRQISSARGALDNGLRSEDRRVRTEA